MSKLKTFGLILTASVLGVSSCGGENKSASSSTTDALISSISTSGLASSSISGSSSNASTNSSSSSVNVDPIPKYAITFKADNYDDVVIEVNRGNYTLPQCMFNLPAYINFKNWLVNGQAMNPGQTINVTGPMTITASLSEPQYVNDERIIIEAFMDVARKAMNSTSPFSTVDDYYSGTSLDNLTYQRSTKRGADALSGRSYDVNDENYFEVVSPYELEGISLGYSKAYGQDTRFYISDREMLRQVNSDMRVADSMSPMLNLYLNHKEAFDKYGAYRMAYPDGRNDIVYEGYDVTAGATKLDNENKYSVFLQDVIIVTQGQYTSRNTIRYDVTFGYDAIYTVKITNILEQKENGQFTIDHIGVNQIDISSEFDEELYDETKDKVPDDLPDQIWDRGCYYDVYYKNYAIGTVSGSLTEAHTLEELSQQLFGGLPGVSVAKVSHNSDLTDAKTDAIFFGSSLKPLYVDLSFDEGYCLGIETIHDKHTVKAMGNWKEEELDLYANLEERDVHPQAAPIKPVAGEKIPLHFNLVGQNLVDVKVNGVSHKSLTYGSDMPEVYNIDVYTERMRNEGGVTASPFTINGAIYKTDEVAYFNLSGLSSRKPLYKFNTSDFTKINNIRVYTGDRYYFKGDVINKADLTLSTDENFKLTFRYADEVASSFSEIPSDYQGDILLSIGYGEFRPDPPIYKEASASSQDYLVANYAYLVIE